MSASATLAPSAAHAAVTTFPSLTPTAAPTSTSTPQPPLTEHEWMPQTVLARLDFIRSDDTALLTLPAPPHFILYADGSLFLEYPLIAGIPYGDQQFLFKKLERQDTCKILNTLDQIGFLDYNPTTYKSDAKQSSSTYIEVNAWKSHKREYPNLSSSILQEITRSNNSSSSNFPVITPAMRKAYYLFGDYPSDGFEVYEPDRLAVWILPLDSQQYPDLQWQSWNFAALSIAGMFSRIDFKNSNYVILDGAVAKALYKSAKESFSTKYYYEIDKRGEKKYYAFYARPLLPYELPNATITVIPAPELITPPSSKLKCQPSDGVIPIPAPNLIFSVP